MSEAIASKSPNALNDWYFGLSFTFFLGEKAIRRLAFRRRRRITTRRVTSYIRAQEEIVLPLVKRYRCNIPPLWCIYYNRAIVQSCNHLLCH